MYSNVYEEVLDFEVCGSSKTEQNIFSSNKKNNFIYLIYYFMYTNPNRLN